MLVMFDITLTWSTLHSGFLQVFVLQVTQKDSTVFFVLCYRLHSGIMQILCVCTLQVTLRNSTGVLFQVTLRNSTCVLFQVTLRDSMGVTGYIQGFYRCVCVCVTGYTEGFNRCFVYVLQVTLRVSTGVLYVCVAGYTQGFYRCSVCQGCIARTTGSQSDPLGVTD